MPRYSLSGSFDLDLAGGDFAQCGHNFLVVAFDQRRRAL